MLFTPLHPTCITKFSFLVLASLAGMWLPAIKINIFSLLVVCVKLRLAPRVQANRGQANCGPRVESFPQEH